MSAASTSGREWPKTLLMGTARLNLRHNLRHRMLAGYGGALGFAISVSLGWWAFGRALGHGDVASAPLLLLVLLGAHRLGGNSIRMTRNAFVSPEILVEANRLVIDDPTTLLGPQSIPFDLVQSVHIGPEVAGWLVGSYARMAGSVETQLGRYPQLPNLLIVLGQPVYVNQARRGMFRLWHLSAPPRPTRVTRRIWATVDDHDAAYLVFADRGVEPNWATPEPSLPVWD